MHVEHVLYRHYALTGSWTTPIVYYGINSHTKQVKSKSTIDIYENQVASHVFGAWSPKMCAV